MISVVNDEDIIYMSWEYMPIGDGGDGDERTMQQIPGTRVISKKRIKTQKSRAKRY